MFLQRDQPYFSNNKNNNTLYDYRGREDWCKCGGDKNKCCNGLEGRVHCVIQRSLHELREGLVRKLNDERRRFGLRLLASVDESRMYSPTCGVMRTQQ